MASALEVRTGTGSPPAELRADGDWITLRARPDFPGRPRLGPLDLLRVNRRLAGGAKFALDPEDGEVVLAADASIADRAARPDGDRFGSALDLRIGRARAGIEEAQAWAAGPSAFSPRSAGAAADASAAGLEDLAALCAASGWPFEEREGGKLVVPLEAAGSGQPAEVARDARGSVRVTVRLSDAAEAAEPCLEAAGVFLLLVSGALRFMRAALAEDEPGRSFILENRFDDPPTPAEMADALTASSLALGMSSREMQALLEDESLARAYLALRGSAFFRASLAAREHGKENPHADS